MKWALISPDEASEDGVRVAQVCPDKFEVALPLYWVPCGDVVYPETHYYKDKAFEEIPIVAQPTITIVEITPQPGAPPEDVA